MKDINELLRSGLSRRTFLAGLGVSAGTAATAMVAGCGGSSVPTVTPTPTTTPSPVQITDTDILNFALNLEYLEAEFYLRAATGSGLSSADIGANPGAVTGGAKVPFVTPAIQAYALEIANDELAHVRYLRKALGSAAVDRPAIDLTNSFSAAATAAGISGGFNPFADENQFLVGAFTFEDVGVTAYNGAVVLIQSAAILSAAAAIHATEAYHAAEIRTILVYQADPTYLNLANKISALRGAASSAADGGFAGEVAVSSKTIVPCDSNSLGFHRTTDQVLHIVYLNATSGAVTSGGFYPNGLNGVITASAS
jgi:hypothetical protein